MSRRQLNQLFSRVQVDGSTAFLPFMTAGLPHPDLTVECFEAMSDAGADAFEVGIPYSDPMMDGPTIQLASSQAMANGMTLSRGFEMVGRIVDATAKPCLIMSYANPVFRLGPEEFARRAADAGAAGLIIADLPLEESFPVEEACHNSGIGLVLFVAPTTRDERLRQVAQRRPVFIYGIAELGVTGERERQSDHPRNLAVRIRETTDVPVVMGVGISTPAHARLLSPHADGVIVGSALVRLALEAADPIAEIGTLSEQMVAALKSGKT